MSGMGFFEKFGSQSDLNNRIEAARSSEAEAISLAIDLGISILVDRQNGHTGAFFVDENGHRGPVLKESHQESSPSNATLVAISRAANLLINGAGTQAHPWRSGEPWIG